MQIRTSGRNISHRGLRFLAVAFSLVSVVFVCVFVVVSLWPDAVAREMISANQNAQNILSISDVQSDTVILYADSDLGSGTSSEVAVPEKEEESNEANKSTWIFPTETIQHDVPFVSQAPQAQWGYPIYQDGCEEASVIMAMRWVRDESLTATQMRDEIKVLSNFEEEQYGFYLDISIVDVERVFRDYYEHEVVELVYEFALEDMVRILSEGSLIIVPANGQMLGNPNFSGGGPQRHMLVIVGYDPKTKEFITNEPGTRLGDKYRYAQDVLYRAIRDYPSGHHEPIENDHKIILVVKN